MKIGIALVLCCLIGTRAQLVEYDFNLLANDLGARIQCPVDSYCLLTGTYAFQVSVDNDFFVSSESDRFSGYTTYLWADDNGTLEVKTCTGEDCSATCDVACKCEQGTFSSGVLDQDATVPCQVRQELPDDTIHTSDEQMYYVSGVTLPEYLSTYCGNNRFSSCGIYAEDSIRFIYQRTLANGTTDFSDCSGDECIVRCDPDCSCTDLLSDDSDTQGQPCTTYFFPTQAPSMTPSEESAAMSVRVQVATAFIGSFVLGFKFLVE